MKRTDTLLVLKMFPEEGGREAIKHICKLGKDNMYPAEESGFTVPGVGNAPDR